MSSNFCSVAATYFTNIMMASLSSAAKAEMVKSKLPNSVLGKVWKLSDLDKDGMLDIDEFALSMHLINVKLDGHDLPAELPEHLVPPSKRGFQA
jgi:hypothetical protein